MWHFSHHSPKGVPTGYHHDIPASNVFATRPDDVQPDAELQICEGNWSGAEADPALLLTLVQSEVDAGYLVEVPLAQALETWGKQVAVGKMLDLTRALQELYALSQTKMQGILGSSKFDLNKFCMHLSQACNILCQHVSLHVGGTCLSCRHVDSVHSMSVLF